MSKVTFIQISDELKNSLSKISEKHLILAEAFSQIALSKNFVNQKSLKNIISKLEDLLSEFNSSLDAVRTGEAESVKLHKENVDSQNKKISELKKKIKAQKIIKAKLKG